MYEDQHTCPGKPWFKIRWSIRPTEAKNSDDKPVETNRKPFLLEGIRPSYRLIIACYFTISLYTCSSCPTLAFTMYNPGRALCVSHKN